MINKVVDSLEKAVSGLQDGMTVMIGGFSEHHAPWELVDAVLSTGARQLTIVSNGVGRGTHGLAGLIRSGRVARIICSFPTTPQNDAFREALERDQLACEICPQGSIAERLRAAGAGLGGVLTPTGLDTELALGKPVYELDGHRYLVERPLPGDFALIRAHQADRFGNVVYRYAQRSFSPLMAMAARCTIVQADHVVEPETLNPMYIHTPGIFVHRVIQVTRGDGQ
jgi:3-oxoadipate CoA-transferase alpha subunit